MGERKEPDQGQCRRVSHLMAWVVDQCDVLRRSPRLRCPRTSEGRSEELGRNGQARAELPHLPRGSAAGKNGSDQAGGDCGHNDVAIRIAVIAIPVPREWLGRLFFGPGLSDSALAAC